MDPLCGEGRQYLTLHNLNIFVKSDFNQAFDSFWSSVMSDLDISQVVGLLVKVKRDDGSIITLGPLFKFSKSVPPSYRILGWGGRALLRKVLNLYISLKGNNYSSITSSTIVFQFLFLNSESTKNLPLPIPKKVKNYSPPRIPRDKAW